MDLLILTAFGVATTLPCIGLWIADARDRPAAIRRSSASATSG